jgi:acetylornithine deacetylase/succinyl-diaminopimelate desuccinylase-like protein
MTGIISDDEKKVLESIRRDELVRLALDLGNINSPPGREGPVADYVEDWLKRNHFQTKTLGLMAERRNVVGMLKGTGGGYSLIFNSHMDTSVSETDRWIFRNIDNPIYYKAWQEGEKLYGNGVVNDKGPMAAFMVAAKAIQECGVKLKGDLLLTMVPGEIGWEPVDEFESPRYLSKETGSRFLVTHGVVGDFALVAEATSFRIASVEAGKAFFKVTVYGDHPVYTPYIPRPRPMEKNPNAIVRMAKLIESIEAWAYEYEQKNRYECPGGTVIPRVNIGGIRGGSPYFILQTAELCAIYMDVRLTPVQSPVPVKEEIEGLCRKLNLEADVDLFLYRRGYEAQNVGPLVEAIEDAHGRILGKKPEPVIGPECSMWRDVNVFNEMGIPSATYGPAAGSGGGNYFLSIDDLLTSARLYALIMLDLCNRDKPAHRP